MEMRVRRRFGETSGQVIDSVVSSQLTPRNTAKSRLSIWKQFNAFCQERNYELLKTTPLTDLANILKDWAFNMKKANGEDYKEGVVKTMWNITSKKLQEMYYKNYGIAFDPFADIIFKDARDARDVKRMQLKRNPDKRKRTYALLSRDDLYTMMRICDENTPSGLQRKFFHIASYQLDWTCREAFMCLLHYFRHEARPDGTLTGRVEYNPAFTKIPLAGSQLITYTCTGSKWLTPNTQCPDLCPVRLLKKLIEKRSIIIHSDKVFLKANLRWNQEYSDWYHKNIEIKLSEIMKWTRSDAERIGVDTKRVKIMGPINRKKTDCVSEAGVNEKLIIKLGDQSGSSAQLVRHLPRLLPKPPGDAAKKEQTLQSFKNMAISCWVPGCNHNNMRESCKFFTFPTNIKQRRRWLQLIRRVGEPGSGARVCACHFSEGKKENGPDVFPYNERTRFKKHHLTPEKKKQRKPRTLRSEESKPSTSTQGEVIQSGSHLRALFAVENQPSTSGAEFIADCDPVPLRSRLVEPLTLSASVAMVKAENYLLKLVIEQKDEIVRSSRVVPEVKSEYIEIEDSKVVDPSYVPPRSEEEDPLQLLNIPPLSVASEDPLNIESAGVPQLNLVNIIKSEPLNDSDQVLTMAPSNDFDNLNKLVIVQDQQSDPDLLTKDLENFGATVASELRLIKRTSLVRKAKMEILRIVQKYQEEDEKD